MSEFESISYCLECAWKHSRDLEHHLEDAVTYTKEAGKRMMFQSLVDKVREIRKKIDELRLKEKGSSENPEGCEGCIYPGENPNPKLAKLEKRCTWTEEKIQPKQYFDPMSFRTLCPECPEKRCALCPPELACATRIIVGCRLGEFVEGRCRVGTETHVIYHGAPKP